MGVLREMKKLKCRRVLPRLYIRRSGSISKPLHPDSSCLESLFKAPLTSLITSKNYKPQTFRHSLSIVQNSPRNHKHSIITHKSICYTFIGDKKVNA